MSLSINIEPTSELQEEILEKYKEEEKLLSTSSNTGRSARIVVIVIALFYIGIPSLILLILRIPLRIIRQLRIWTASRKFYRDHIKLYEDEYEWRERPKLEFPERKPTRRAKREEEKRAKRKEELKKQMEEMKQSYTGEVSTLGYAFDYASYLSAYDHFSGPCTAICILHQFKENLFEEEGKPKADLPESLSFGKVCRNMSVCFSNLRMPNQSNRYMQLALKHGNISEEDMKPQLGKALRNLILKPDLLLVVWDGFEKDLINFWPSPYFTRRVLVGSPVEEVEKN